MSVARRSDSVVSPDSVDGQLVAYFNADKFLEGFATAAIDAFRTSLPARHLPGQTTFKSTHMHATIDVREQQITSLKAMSDDAHRRAKRAMAFALDAPTEEEAEDWQRESRKARHELEQFEQSLRELEAAPTHVDPDAGFDVLTDVFVRAFVRLARSGNKVAQEDFVALKTLLPDFDIRYRNGRWCASTSIRVNTSEGVADLGPIEWLVPTNGRGVASLRMNVDDGRSTGAGSRNHLRWRLQEEAGLRDAAAQVLVNAPFKELPYVVLHHRIAEPYPEWVGDDWREPAFGAWVTKVYADPEFTWLGMGKYAQTSPLRQAVASYAESREKFRLIDVLNDLPISEMLTVHRVTRTWQENKSARPWSATIEIIEYRRGGAPGASIAAGVDCVCGRKAAIVARVPEVPADLLCECLRMPNAAAHGLDEDMLFPAAYRKLRIPWDQCLQVLEDQFEAWESNMPSQARKILSMSDLLEPGASGGDIGERLRVLTPAIRSKSPAPAGSALRQLERHGMVNCQGGWPAIWTYTAKGRAVAGRLSVSSTEGGDALDVKGGAAEVAPAANAST